MTYSPQKVIYVQAAEQPIVKSTSLLRPGMTRADLPLVSEPGHIASKRKNDHRGFVNLDKSKVKRFDGEGSMYRRDSFTYAY
jgi:hypothetical protein